MNPQRGDVTITLGGRDYVLRPTFDALVGLEGKLETGLVPLARQFLEGRFGLREVNAILVAGIEGAGQRPPDDLGELIVKDGIAGFTEPLVQFLSGALRGDARGNAAAPPGETS